MDLNKEYGQVFLKESSYLKKVAYALPLADKIVLEIGPGSGRLTELLLPQVKKLICVELDPRMCALLEGKFSQAKNLEIVNQDITKFSFDRFDQPIILIGNVPYQISSELIKLLVEQRKKIAIAGFTLQKEVVQKLAAKPGDSQYGFISCQMQFFAKVEDMFTIPASAFSPAPRVNSGFVKLEFLPQSSVAEDKHDEFLKMLRQAFSARRKKLTNALSFLADKEPQLRQMGIDPDLRPEKISLTQFIQIFNLLFTLLP